ncbi:hypothetical protein E5676_scaffold455G005560 [Cucumis melo var. makuwa]|uniref:Reverse transcriptase domain-containing protein n=1 Tax=Cucumis melo var. makuwa TaxID=1194695 RepID=A0A5D3E6J9_CUCMM|nr:hypothetical protein E5676_scaffold455G005560 [Cucumis melo var. makuwa]
MKRQKQKATAAEGYKAETGSSTGQRLRDWMGEESCPIETNILNKLQGDGLPENWNFLNQNVPSISRNPFEALRKLGAKMKILTCRKVNQSLNLCRKSPISDGIIQIRPSGSDSSKIQIPECFICVSSKESVDSSNEVDLKLDSEIEGTDLNALFNDEDFPSNKIPMDLPKDLFGSSHDSRVYEGYLEFSFIKSLWSSKDIGWDFVASVGSYGGILTMWDSSKISVTEVIKRRFSLSIKCLSLCKKVGILIYWAHERFPIGRSTRGMSLFNKFIDSVTLMEIPLQNGRFAWSRDAQAKVKEREKILLLELEKYDYVAELIGLNEEEIGSRTALQAELLGIYQNEEHNYMQKMEEIFKALKALGSNIAPGPDGFTAEFLIKHCAEKRECNSSQGFPPNQSHYLNIQGRQILDPILIANEAVEDYREKLKKDWILKLDLEKAFDRVDWNFLENTLSLKKFNPKWISWIMGCLKNPKFSIFVNGKPRGRITASRGIRQGDPFSPFLFLLVSEVLGEIINKLHSNGQFEGFLVGKDMIHLPLLQFSNDTLLFCKYDVQMFLKLKDAIRLFEWCSGQKVNWEKSAISGVNVEKDDLIQTANLLGCKVEKLPIIYLGLPLGGYPWQKMF